MAGNSGSSKKADERRARNLASANVSRQRRKEHIAALTDEKARLSEANELLRTRLSMKGSGGVPAARAGSSSKGGAQLGPGVAGMVRKKDVDDKAALDLLNRAVAGGKGKGAPYDADSAKKWSDASKKAPSDVQRPMKYGAGGKSAKGKPSSSKKR